LKAEAIKNKIQEERGRPKVIWGAFSFLGAGRLYPLPENPGCCNKKTIKVVTVANTHV